MNWTLTVRPRKGVTVLEIAMVMTLAGIVLGLVMPKIRTVRDNMSVDSVAYDLARDLGRARMEAIKRNQKLTFTRLADTAYQVGDESPRRLPAGVLFNEGASAESVTFTSMGVVADGTSQIKVKSASDSRVVVIRGSGHVSVK
jgi:hypothetical protein